MIALSPLDSGRFLRGERMIVIQTTLDQKAMIALARINRKTVRRGRSSPVRTFACTVAAVELGLAALFVWTGAGGWFINVLMAAIMIACVLGEDTVNGLMGLRQILPEGREVNVTFKSRRRPGLCTGKEPGRADAQGAAADRCGNGRVGIFHLPVHSGYCRYFKTDVCCLFRG